MAGWGKGIPRNVEPAVAGQELVGVGRGAEKFHKLSELLWVSRTDIGCLTDEVLGVVDATHQTVYPSVSESGVDHDGADDEPCRLQ